jgi:hypothetical protein
MFYLTIFSVIILIIALKIFQNHTKSVLSISLPNGESLSFLEEKVCTPQEILGQTSRTRPCTRYPWLSARGEFGLRVRLLSVRFPGENYQVL